MCTIKTCSDLMLASAVRTRRGAGIEAAEAGGSVRRPPGAGPTETDEDRGQSARQECHREQAVGRAAWTGAKRKCRPELWGLGLGSGERDRSPQEGGCPPGQALSVRAHQRVWFHTHAPRFQNPCQLSRQSSLPGHPTYGSVPSQSDTQRKLLGATRRPGLPGEAR